MRLGALLSPPDGTDSGSIHAQARTFEAEGYSSIWSAHAMGRGFMLADPLIALTIAAAVTTQVELGTGILQLPLYNPTDIALKSWTLALVSGGRFVLGVGAGSTEADYRVHRQSFTNRFRQFDTALASLQETFRTGEVDGVSLAPWQGVAPPKILFGTWGRRVERAARAFDGWLASGMHRSVEECAGALKGFRAAGGGRAVVTTIQLHGGTDVAELKDRLAQFAEAGFDDAVVMFLPGAPSVSAVRKLVD